MSAYGGPVSAAASSSPLLAATRLVAAAMAGSATQRCVCSASSKAPVAAVMPSTNIALEHASKGGGSRPRKSSPTRPRLMPQYMQCSSTLASEPPSSISGSRALTSCRYASMRRVAQLSSRASLPSASLPPLLLPSACAGACPCHGCEAKIARYCMVMSKRCTRCASVRRFRKSYGDERSSAATCAAMNASRQRRNSRRSVCSSKPPSRRR
mmetsp:Transcript_22711/g.70155  ORF Transcript_22711/g.70155 Transcript_22711/m.70155 type:complete len:211 (+) Transcript_22711:530-1162(+)